jgi:SAM-dependent methyltransferase
MATVCYAIIAIGLIVSALVSRRRILQCAIIHDAPHAPAALYRFITAEGAAIEESRKRAASHCAGICDLDVLDLVPADLPAEKLLALMQLYNPGRYRANRIGGAVSAGHALLIAEAVANRAGIGEDRAVSEDAFFTLARRLKKCAPGRAGIAIAPDFKSVQQAGMPQHEGIGLIYGNLAAVIFSINLATVAIILLGLFASPYAALPALLALHAQPLIATLATPVRPKDLFSATLLRSLVLMISSLAGIADMLKRRRAHPGRMQAAAEYAGLLAAGTERFFDPRSQTCPLCAGGNLARLLQAHEPVMHKPGTFVLEQCRACGHIFQNPPLNATGLSFYYRDLYDGLGAPLTELILGSDDSVYRRRVKLFARYCTPGRWLDVGGGNGYLCCVARGEWPRARFDGLDLSCGIQEAKEQGWIDHGYRGFFPDYAGGLAGAYDAVSMIQFLEHTVKPVENLQAAHTALAEGGLLFVEVPNPGFLPGRMLGRFWFQWLQPQHLHFFSIANMEKLLRECGFTPLARHVRESHIPIDFVMAAVFLLRLLAPPDHYPWHQKKGLRYALWRCAVFTLGSPLIAAGFLADMLLLPLFKACTMSNNYLIVARRADIPEKPAGSGSPSR